MSEEKDKPFFVVQNLGFLPAEEKDDLLHPEANKLVTADSLTETQYFGFSVPDAGIHALTYLWHHPNLRVVSGGVWAWRGIKQYMVQSELCDFRSFMNDSPLKNDLHEFRFENGYGVKIIEPLKRFHVTYSDSSRHNSVDLIYDAVSPAIKFADGLHLEQAMRVRGELVLRGKRYDVDCFNVRDRSWGKARTEAILTLPPTTYMTGVFNTDFAFHCNVFDQVSGNPELTGAYAIPEHKTLSAGWIYRGGKVGRLITAKKRVTRDPNSLFPLAIELDATDELGRTMNLRGTLIACCPQQPWFNVNIIIGLMRWECEGMVTFGDCQEGIWSDYYNFMAAQRE